MRIAIISTGDELLRGEIADTNAVWMAAELAAKGLRVSRICVVGDDVVQLTSALTDAFADHDLVLVGGGLGPTEDDLTTQAAAIAIGSELTRDTQAATQVEAAFTRLNRTMNPINLKQADLPAGCQVLENPIGTAPGFATDTPRGGRALFFPGVPVELRSMFERHVPAELPERDDDQPTALFKCFGMGESDIQAALASIKVTHPEVRLAFRTSFPEIRVSLLAPDPESLTRATAKARLLLGRAVFAEQDIGLPQALGQALTARGLTIATAESCTGGLIGHSITEVPGSSAYFLGGVVAYDNQVKISALNVDPELIHSHGAVSAEVAAAMASGARAALGADLALATSGIAGPQGGSAEKPVGLVHLAIAGRDNVVGRRHVFKGYDRSRVKRAAAWWAMRATIDAIMESR